MAEGFGSLIPTMQQLIPRPVYSSTPVTRQGAAQDAVQGMRVNPLVWQQMLESAPPSLNIEDQRNMQQVYYDELWDRTMAPRARQLSPEERTWAYNYGAARHTDVPQRINEAFGSLMPSFSSLRGPR